METLEEHYLAHDIEVRILDALRAAGLNTEQKLSPEELAPLDHFHTGGYQSSLRLQDMSNILAGDRVLDLGAGLAGPARMLAASPGCHVDCIDLSPDYCIGAKLLNRLTGLEDKIEVHMGSALDLPFPDNSFDAVWMQNVGMNIENKQKLYSEIHRILKSNGQFIFQEMAAGDSVTSYFPLPWATHPSDNFLITSEEMHSVLDEIGFVAEFFEDSSDTQLNFKPNTDESTPTPQVQLSLSTYVDDLAEKAENSTRSLVEGQIRFIRAVFRVK